MIPINGISYDWEEEVLTPEVYDWLEVNMLWSILHLAVKVTSEPEGQSIVKVISFSSPASKSSVSL